MDELISKWDIRLMKLGVILSILAFVMLVWLMLNGWYLTWMN